MGSLERDAWGGSGGGLVKAKKEAVGRAKGAEEWYPAKRDAWWHYGEVQSRIEVADGWIGDDDLKLSVAKQSDTTDLYQTTLPPLTCRTKTQQRQSLGLL